MKNNSKGESRIHSLQKSTKVRVSIPNWGYKHVLNESISGIRKLAVTLKRLLSKQNQLTIN
ncbi:MAG: hypothetical protein IPP77_01220 [Bacteroidetes bacterium]|nr:hypothetical protein [Bacteroidota bacterium]